MKKILAGMLGLAMLVPFGGHAQLDQLMPQPRQVEAGKATDKYRLNASFTANLREKGPTRVDQGLVRFLQRLDGRTGLNLPDFPDKLHFPGDGLNVWVKREGELKLGEDESYSIQVNARRIMLEAETDLGAMHGLETLLQMLSADAEGFYFPACKIQDQPRFPWRGLLIDVCRHWQPVEVIKRNLDGMAAMKMNVFHWHLSEDQGFRVECKTFPMLHQLGSNGNYFSQEQVKDIIAYADARGIRVVPEFDIPGHATSWFVGYPELASAPGPYEIEKKFGVFDPAFNPANEKTYQFFEQFFAEMGKLFPDAYMHIGGDENEGKQWDKNAEVQQMKKDKGLKDNHAVQAYFNNRLLEILTENGKRMVGWDEIFQPEMPKNIVIQSWRGKEALKKAAEEGYDVMLSNGYYIDLCQSTSYHYLNDPLPAELGLGKAAEAHVLGGEATMWAELVSPETIDSRIWPRLCAIAERFWSDGSQRDVEDMYRRLPKVSRDLEELGLLHIKNQEMMMRRMLRGQNTLPLSLLVSVVGPLQGYKRHSQGIAYSTELPLSRLPDIAIPDPQLPRDFARAMQAYIAQKDMVNELILTNWLDAFKRNHAELQKMSAEAPMLKEVLPLSAQLEALAVAGSGLVEMHKGGKPDESRKAAYKDMIANAAKPVSECELLIVAPIEQLWKAVYGE
jgi:hexosaminidase